MEAFKSEDPDAHRMEHVKNAVKELTKTVESTLLFRNPDSGVIHLEAIQDRVEVALMRSNYPEIAKRYIKLLNFNKKISLPRYNNNDSYFVFQILLIDKFHKLSLMKQFKKFGIGVSVHYGTPLPLMTYYKKKYNIKKINFLNSKNYGDRVLSLPIYPKLKNKEIDQIGKLINKYIN